MEQSENYAENLAIMLLDNIKDNQENLDRIIELLDEKMISVGNDVVMNIEHVDSKYLKELCGNFSLQEINLYDNEGEIIISSVDSLIGRKYEKGSPIDRFVRYSERVNDEMIAIISERVSMKIVDSGDNVQYSSSDFSST